MTWIQTHPQCSPLYISHPNMCPISAFPSAWNIQHIHERDSILEKPHSAGTAQVNTFYSSFTVFKREKKKNTWKFLKNRSSTRFYLPEQPRVDMFPAARRDYSKCGPLETITAQHMLLVIKSEEKNGVKHKWVDHVIFKAVLEKKRRKKNCYRMMFAHK